MTTQTVDNIYSLEWSEGTQVSWEICRGFWSVVAASVRKTGEKIKMILLPWNTFISGDIEKGEEDVMIQRWNERVTIWDYLEDTADDQEKFLWEWERMSLTHSIRHKVRQVLQKLNQINQ